MKKYLILLSVLFISVNVFADEKPFITVLDFKANNIPEMEVVVFVDYLSAQIQKSGQYRVIDRMQRENILTELEFSNSGCTDESCQLEIGKLLQARQMIVGSMGTVGDAQILNIKLVEVETGETINSASKQYTDMNEMLTGSSQLIDELLNIQTIEKTPLKINVAEEETPAVVVEEKNVEKEKNIEVVEIPSDIISGYSETTPITDLLLPGASHFKAGNGGMGFVYLLSAIGGATIFGISEYLFNSEFAAYSEATTATDATSLYNSSEQWRNISIIGVSVWAGSALISTIHAMIAKGAEGN